MPMPADALPSPTDDYASEERFVRWLLRRVVEDATGASVASLPIPPAGRFWLGRLAPEEKTRRNVLGERGERMEPCEVGIRVRPSALDGRTVECTVTAVSWIREGGDKGSAARWAKLEKVEVLICLDIPTSPGIVRQAGRVEIDAAFKRVGADHVSAEVRAEIEDGQLGPELVVTLVNVSSDEAPDGVDSNLYEVGLSVDMGSVEPFVLDALPDSFRYSRAVGAYGINAGVHQVGPTSFAIEDVAVAAQPRPGYWDESAGSKPDITFLTLARDPLPSLSSLVTAIERWGRKCWGTDQLEHRAIDEAWTPHMREEARREALKFEAEVARIRAGLALLEDDTVFLRAFQLTNAAFGKAITKYDGWRPFQLGFLLLCLPSLHPKTRAAEAKFVDTLWFATGGGKTETYLGLLVMAAFLDRLTGKALGITSWTRFPLRMLSLQQLQRFADIFAAAEMIRRSEKVKGATFSLGFLVGPATPNRIVKEPGAGQPDWRDQHMPDEFQVLLRCPFCRTANLRMQFDPRRWTLDHVCINEECQWVRERLGALPFHVVDEEIYRFLPTAVIGTLDKAANIGMQAAMRAFYGAPSGWCPSGHGFTYAPRSAHPNGCLFPDCDAKVGNLPQPPERFPPTIRLQDELHLLRDSLGAVASHYEGLFDHLQSQFGTTSKILASSATLQGYEEQSWTLYQREGRLFPIPGPKAGQSFWSVETPDLMRLFAGAAPRGVTMEFASDRANEALQQAIRQALSDPNTVAAEAAVHVERLPALVCQYGVGVVYGSTLRDVEAAARSFETQIPIEPLNSVRLTGSTPFEDVRRTLEFLETDCDRPFGERIHLIAASSMLSHGVDIERLNVMVMLGLPLSTAEFIQTTSRVGRSHPGLVLVLHRIGRERDASVFRSFVPIIHHADRLIDPVPITRKSRRVLDVTFAGLFSARVLGVHEPRALKNRLQPLTTVARIRAGFDKLTVLEEDEYEALVDLLGIRSPLDENIRADLRALVRATFRAINDPATNARFLSDALPNGGPMLSLRDVEDQVPVYTRRHD